MIFELAKRFLFSKRRENFFSAATWVAVAGLAFGVAALLISLSITSGFQKEYKKSILGFNSHLILMDAHEIADPEAVAQKFSKYGPFKGWTPFLYREGLTVSGSQVKGVVLKGVDFEKYSRLSGMKLDFNDTSNPEHLPALLLGKKLAEEIQGKNLRILFPTGWKEKDQDVRRFFVEGTFESGLHEYDSTFAFLSLADAEKFFKTGGKVSGIEIWLDDPEQAEEWAVKMRKDFEYPYVVLTWRDLNESLFRAIQMEKLIFSILMTVLIGIASLNLLGALMMLLIEKRSEVAILRATGLPWSRIRKLFLFDGLLIGSVGIFLGIAIGWCSLYFLKHWQPIHLAPEVYFVSNVPVSFSVENFSWVAVSAFLIVLLGCELALRGVSRMNVVRTLLER